MNLNAPKRVIRIERDELSRTFPKNPDIPVSMKKQIDICSYEDELPALIECYGLPKDIDEGDTFIQSPYDPKVYWRIENYEDYTIRQKNNKMVEIAQLLGIKSYSCEVQLLELKKRQIDVNAKGGYKLVTADASVKSSIDESMRQTYKMTNEWQGKRPSQDKYEEAIQIAKEYGLYNDPTVNNLLIMCDPSKNNKLGKQEISYSINTDINKNLDIACNIASCTGFQVNAEFESKTEYHKELVVHFTMEFSY